MTDKEDKELLEAAARSLGEGDMVKMLLKLTLAEYRVRNCIDPAKFDLGDIMVTRAAQVGVPQIRIIDSLARHGAGQWGSLLSAYDQQINEMMLKAEGRLTSSWAIDPSSYSNGTVNAFWIITDSPGLLTTVLLPDDY